MIRKTVSGFAVIAFLLVTLPAYAGVTVFNDYATWQSYTTGATTINFEGLVPTGQIADYSNSAGLTIAGVNFVGEGANGSTFFLELVADPAYWPPAYDWGTGANLVGPGGPLANDGNSANSYEGAIKISLPGGFTSISMDLMPRSPNGTPVSVTLSTGDSFSVNTIAGPGNVPTFFGLTSTDPITSLSVAATGKSMLNIDNFMFGQDPAPASAPEPATLTMLAVGAIALLRRRK